MSRWNTKASVPFPVLGLLDVGRAFRLDFDFGATPPTLSLEPYMNLRPVSIASVDVVRYADQRHRLSDDQSAFRLEP